MDAPNLVVSTYDEISNSMSIFNIETLKKVEEGSE
jgi:hypothetical protein